MAVRVSTKLILFLIYFVCFAGTSVAQEFLPELVKRIKPSAVAGLNQGNNAGLPLSEISGVVLPVEKSDGRHIYNQLVIRSGRRDELIKHLKDRNIGSEIYYPVPMHAQECFADLNYQPGDFPLSESAAAETLALPIYPELSEEMIATVVDAIADFYKSRLSRV